jgi:hypothetical protein
MSDQSETISDARRLAIREVGDGSGGVAFERLVSMLGNAVNFRISRGERWPDLTPEERAAAVVAGLEQRGDPGVDPDVGFPRSKQPRVDLSDYQAMVSAVNRMRDDGSVPEEAA